MEHLNTCRQESVSPSSTSSSGPDSSGSSVFEKLHPSLYAPISRPFCPEHATLLMEIDIEYDRYKTASELCDLIIERIAFLCAKVSPVDPMTAQEYLEYFKESKSSLAEMRRHIQQGRYWVATVGIVPSMGGRLSDLRAVSSEVDSMIQLYRETKEMLEMLIRNVTKWEKSRNRWSPLIINPSRYEQHTLTLLIALLPAKFIDDNGRELEEFEEVMALSQKRRGSTATVQEVEERFRNLSLLGAAPFKEEDIRRGVEQAAKEPIVQRAMKMTDWKKPISEGVFADDVETEVQKEVQEQEMMDVPELVDVAGQ